MRDGQRRLFDDEPSRVRPRARWALVAVGIGALPGCMFIANLGQFEGAIEVHDAGDDASIVEASVLPDGGADVVIDASLLDATHPDAGDAGASPDAAATDADATTDGAIAESGPLPCVTMWPETGTNVATNPDFAEAGAGWSALYGGTFSVSSAQAYCSSTSGEISARTAFYESMATNIPTTPGTYNVALWVLQDGTTARPVAAGGVCIPAEGGATVYTPVIQVVATPNTWTFLTGALTVPSGCATMQFFVGQPQSEMAQTTFPDIFADAVYVGQ